MCRNIKVLFNFDPPATDKEIKEASLQFVRKISGFRDPSNVNIEVFNKAVDKVTKTSRKLIDALATNAPKRDRETEAKLARARAVARFGSLKQ